MTYTRSKQKSISRRRDRAPDNIMFTGSSLLLVSILILCLVTFAALNLSTAKSDLSYSRRLVNSRQDYYAACNSANEIIAQVQDRLIAADEGKTSPDFTDLPVVCSEGLVSFSVPVNERQELMVELSLDSDEYYYNITTFQVVTVVERGEDTLNLMNVTGEY